MAVNQVTMTAPGFSTPLILDRQQFRFGVGLLATVQSGVSSCLYHVQVTGDPNIGPNGAAFTNWNLHDLMQNLTASANGNLAFPVTAVRLWVVSISATGGAAIVLNMVTALPGGS